MLRTAWEIFTQYAARVFPHFVFPPTCQIRLIVGKFTEKEQTDWSVCGEGKQPSVTCPIVL